MIQLLIRADDVGYSEGVNYGVEKSVKYGLIRSVGLMPNMPAAAHGVRLLEGTDTALGQHTNVCLGTPCSAAEDIPSMVDDKGQFLSSRVHRKAFSEGKDLIDLEDAVRETEAQYFRFKELTGREPDYFEAHAISGRNLWKALEIAAEKYDLPYNQMNPEDKIGYFRGRPAAVCEMWSMRETMIRLNA